MAEDASVVKKIQTARQLGFSLSEAVVRNLGVTLTAWAADHGYRPSEVSMCLGGYPERPYASIRDDLASDLGIPREVLDELIDDSGEVAA